MKLCTICGGVLTRNRSVYCSRECFRIGLNAYQRKWRLKRKPLRHGKCVYCGGPYVACQRTQKFCSAECARRVTGAACTKRWYHAHYKPKGRIRSLRCVICGEVFNGPFNSKYCSKRCWRKSPSGKKETARRLEVRRIRYRTDAAYRDRHRRKAVESQMKRYYSDPIIRIKTNLRKRVRILLRNGASGISGLIGCSGSDLRKWLESQFNRWMTWENYGKYWVVDHKIPLAKFNLSDRKQREVACHYTNLQPLTRVKNHEKSDTITDGQLALRIPVTSTH